MQCAFVPVMLNCTVGYSGCGRVLSEYDQTLLHVPLGISSLIILATCELLTLTHCIVSTLVRWHFSDGIKQARKMRTSPRRYHNYTPQVQSLWLISGNIWYALMTRHPYECIILCNKCVYCFASTETGGNNRGKMASEVWERNTLIGFNTFYVWMYIGYLSC